MTKLFSKGDRKHFRISRGGFSSLEVILSMSLSGIVIGGALLVLGMVVEAKSERVIEYSGKAYHAAPSQKAHFEAIKLNTEWVTMLQKSDRISAQNNEATAYRESEYLGCLSINQTALDDLLLTEVTLSSSDGGEFAYRIYSESSQGPVASITNTIKGDRALNLDTELIRIGLPNPMSAGGVGQGARFSYTFPAKRTALHV